MNSNQDITGNPGKRKPKSNPVATGQPQPPEYLSKAAKGVFSNLVAQLGQSGIAGEIDAVALATLAENMVLSRKAQDQIDATGGEIVTGPNGGQLQNAWLSVKRKAEDNVIDLCKQFGMTPQAREKISIKPEVKDDLDSFLNE